MTGFRALMFAVVAMTAFPLAKPGAAVAATPQPGFAIAGAAIGTSEILDARALPDVSGKASILLTFDAPAAARLRGIFAKNGGKLLPVTLDGQELYTLGVEAPLAGDTLVLPGPYRLEEAEALALRISGKPPLPDSLEAE